MATKYSSPEVKKEYKRERSRILKQVRRMFGRGYYFDTNVIPDIPQKVDAGSVRRLQKITTKSLYSKAKWKDPTGMETAETAGHARNIERRRASEKAVQTRRSRTVAKKATQRKATPDKREPPKPKQPEPEQEETEASDEEDKITEDEDLEEDFSENLEEKVEIKYAPDNQEKRYKPEDSESQNGIGKDDLIADEMNEILNRIKEILDEWTPETTWSDAMAETKAEDVSRTREIIDNILRNYDAKTIAENAKKNADRIISLVEEIAYKTSGGSRKDYSVAREKVDANITELVSLLTNGNVSPNEMYGLTEMQESYEIDY